MKLPITGMSGQVLSCGVLGGRVNIRLLMGYLGSWSESESGYECVACVVKDMV